MPIKTVIFDFGNVVAHFDQRGAGSADLDVDKDAGTVRVAYNATETLANRFGAIHGGMTAAMLDDVISLAAGLTIEMVPYYDAKTGELFFDDFMRAVEKLGPKDMTAIARQAYIEMLKAGYTAVGEFHYLHHRPDGGSYDDPAEMSARIAGGLGDAFEQAEIAWVETEFAQFQFVAESGAQRVNGVIPQHDVVRHAEQQQRVFDLSQRNRHFGDGLLESFSQGSSGHNNVSAFGCASNQGVPWFS